MPESTKVYKHWTNPTTGDIVLLTEAEAEWQAGLDALLIMFKEWVECCEAQARPEAALVSALDALDAMREVVLGAVGPEEEGLKHGA